MPALQAGPPPLRGHSLLLPGSLLSDALDKRQGLCLPDCNAYVEVRRAVPTV